MNKTIKKSRRLWWHIGILLIIIAAIVAVRAPWREAADAAYEYQTVATGSIVRTASGTGRVQAINRQVLLSPQATQITEIRAKVGTVARNGQVLLRGANGFEVRAPFAGEVSAIFVEPNQLVSPGARLIEIIDFSKLEVSAQVDELDVARISLGQTAQIDIIALSDESLSGPITHIAREGTVSGNATTFNVRVAIPSAANILLGMSAEIRIEVARADNVPVVPIEAVQYKDRSPFVLVSMTPGQPEQRFIEMGLSDGKFVEVKGGLEVGSTIAFVPLVVEERPRFAPRIGGAR